MFMDDPLLLKPYVEVSFILMAQFLQPFFRLSFPFTFPFYDENSNFACRHHLVQSAYLCFFMAR